jgi:ribosome-associated protein
MAVKRPPRGKQPRKTPKKRPGATKAARALPKIRVTAKNAMKKAPAARRRPGAKRTGGRGRGERGARVPARPNPQALELARRVAAAAAEKKAADVLVIDTTERGDAIGYDYLVLASGDSDRQLDAMRSSIEDALETEGRRVRSVEASPDWILVDLGDVVVHLFSPERRSMYDLEALWSSAPTEHIAAAT